MKIKFVIFFLFISAFATAQVQIFNLKPFQKATLSDTLKETSGLTVFENRLFTINDSGNLAEIYEINPDSGTILKTYKTNVENIDWESITHDEENFYIGDFGNNLGTRRDLYIYKIPFVEDSLNLNNIQKINFLYPEQTEFIPRNINNNFDGEAMIYLNGKLHIFTKEWKSKKVTHYTIDPEISDLQEAQKVEEFPSGFVVTDAGYYEEKLYLVGYNKKMEIYLLEFYDFSDDKFFNGKYKKYFLGMSTRFGQVEGLATSPEGIFLSNEEFHKFIFHVKQSLYFIPYKDLK